MKVYNNTPNQTYYGISNAGGFECGDIAANQTADFPEWDNQENVKVLLSGEPSTAFTITIPETKTGMAVTIGLYQE